MSTLKSSIPLISKWEDYCLEDPKGSLHDFAKWLMKEEQIKVKDTPSNISKQNAAILDNTAQISLLITRLHRLLVLFTKPITNELGFSKDHEFGVLVQIAISNNPNKKEIADKALLEISTTVEITKRLAQKGLIKEEKSAGDRRSARLSVTKKGKILLQNSYEKMQGFYEDFITILSVEEQDIVKRLLNKINHYNTSKLKR